MEGSRETLQSASDTRVGDVLAGKYRLEALLGTGGMGDVYRAVNELVGRGVAIKLLKKEHAKNKEVVERFMREARAANLVRHPNVVDVLDIGQAEDGSPFIVQELLTGEDLGRYVELKGGKLPLAEVIELLCPVIDAVAEAHAQGVVHRDIKPENVFLSRKGTQCTPKLLDFGISKVRTSNVRATEVGVTMGTPAYMPPEQVQGARDADARSDVWALGVMLFELLAGRLPFDANDAPALFVAIATQDAPRLVDVAPGIPPNVSRLVERCLRRKPDDRYPSAAELARDLRHVLDDEDPEPTLRRSLAPSSVRVPDLLLPGNPGTPVMTKGDLKRAGLGQRDADELADARGNAQAAAAARNALAKAGVDLAPLVAKGARPEPPSLSPPRRPPPPNPPAAKAAAPARPAAHDDLEVERGGASHLDANAGMPGIMLAQSQSAPSRPRPVPTQEAWVPPETGGQENDMSWVIGIGVVTLLAVVGWGTLMQLAHRSEGWPLFAFLMGPGSPVNTVGQIGLGLICAAGGVSYVQRGVKYWRGELAGGAQSAVFAAIFAAGAFFAAVELISATW